MNGGKDLVIHGSGASPIRISPNIYSDVKDMKPTPNCSRQPNIIADFERCYTELLKVIQYVDQDRCYRAEQIQEAVWVGTRGAQIVELPRWCGK